MSVLLDSALAYLARGWSVIPLTPDSKKPAIDWKEFIDRKPTEEEVRRWWSDKPNCNIGVVTGPVSGICVVDVDSGDPAEIYKEAPCEMIQKTPKGWHLVYRHPGFTVLTRAGVRPGIDVRGDGGYIVASPSVVNGKEYKWTRTSIDLSDPPGVVAGIDPLDRKTGEQFITGGDGVSTDRWVADMFEGAQKGTRNQAAARLAGYLASKDIPIDIAKNLLEAWNTGKNEDPDSMPRSEIDRTVESIYNKDNIKRRIQAKQGNSSNLLPAKFDTMTLSEYAKKYSSDDVSWIIEDWMPLDTIAFLVSEPGSFKTWLLLDAMLSIATGKPFLGKWDVHKRGSVVLIQQEDNHAALVNRINTVLWSKFNLGEREEHSGEFRARILPHDIPVHIYPDRMLRFDNPAMVEAFKDSMRRIRPLAVFIDPLYTAVSLDNYMGKAAEQMLVLKSLRDELGCTFVIAHHTKKSGGDNNAGKSGGDDDNASRMDIWGSQFLNAFLETGWQIRRTNAPNIIKIRRHFKDANDPNEIALEMEIDDEHMDAKPDKEHVSKRTKDAYSDIMQYLINVGPSNISSLAKHFNRSRNTIRSHMRELELLGDVMKTGDGKLWAAKQIKEIAEGKQASFQEFSIDKKN